MAASTRASEIEMTLSSFQPGQLRVLLGPVFGVLKSARTRVLDQLRIVRDRVADRIDPGGVTAGADDHRQHVRR